MVAVPNDLTPSARAGLTARWATTMTRWAIRFASAGKRAGTKTVKRWQFVSFAGPAGAESRGIVDLIAIRRDHGACADPFKRGDLFEIVLIQVKGGGAAWPTIADLTRLRAVQRRYRAKAVVLASWQRGAEPAFYALRGVSAHRTRAWRQVEAVDIFGTRARKLSP